MIPVVENLYFNIIDIGWDFVFFPFARNKLRMRRSFVLGDQGGGGGGEEVSEEVEELWRIYISHRPCIQQCKDMD